MTAFAFTRAIEMAPASDPARPWATGGSPAGMRVPDSVYLRRRLLVAAILTVLTVAGAMLADVPILLDTVPAAQNHQGDLVVYTVRAGDSYASIAAALDAPYPAEAAQRLKRANAGANLSAGQRLVLQRDLIMGP